MAFQEFVASIELCGPAPQGLLGPDPTTTGDLLDLAAVITNRPFRGLTALPGGLLDSGLLCAGESFCFSNTFLRETPCSLTFSASRLRSRGGRRKLFRDLVDPPLHLPTPDDLRMDVTPRPADGFDLGLGSSEGSHPTRPVIVAVRVWVEMAGQHLEDFVETVDSGIHDMTPRLIRAQGEL
ncbi:hypothetical protein [Nocardia sienata]|uniref:hypothetical protein n=1 Tax=Nocardia sienata TaxID=248552 RepID=UPI0007A493D0|nr:hypothetical protein [Nocardia sienata]